MIQLQFLNHLLKSKDISLITLNNLNTEYFSDYPREFNYIKAHLDVYGQIPDTETFISQFQDFDIIDVQESPRYLLAALYEDKNKRALIKIFNDVKNALNNNDTEQALKIFNKSKDTLSAGVVLESVDIIRDTSRYDKYVERVTDYTKHYVKTGFPELDEVIGGWDKEEELATIVARPGVGKSFCLLKIALAAAVEGLNVGLYSGEMTVNKVGFRIDTLLSHISNTKIIRGNESIQLDYKKFLESLSDQVKGTIKVLTPDKIGGPAGVSALRAFIEKEHLDMLCVDQHSLLEDDRGARNAVDKASNISKDLKNLQTLTHIPIISASQQNRSETGDNGATSANVAQTDRISQDSTILIFLDQKDGILTLSLVKARDTASGKKLKYAIDLDKGLFRFIPESTDATGGKQCTKLKEEFEIEPF